MTRKILLIILLPILSFWLGSRVFAQEADWTDPGSGIFPNITSVSVFQSDIDEFLNAGAQYYIAWQFSGDKSNPIETDAYSFYKDGPTCAILKAKAAKYPGRIGVNVHALSNKTDAQITDLLSSAKNDCGASIVRFWGFDNPANVTKVLRIAGNLEVKTIVALIDFGSIAPNPVAWYSTNYKASYQSHALAVADAINSAGLQNVVYALELANEPHCFGLTACLTPYNNWARDMSNLLVNKGFRVGIGQKANENTTRGDSPGAGSPPDFQASNNFTSLSVASGHYYNPSEKALVLKALAISKSLRQEFYIGEAGSISESGSGKVTEITTVRPQPRPTLRPCTTEDNPEFHPLRPYPGEPCDPLIPRSILPANDPYHIPVGTDTFPRQLEKDYQMRNRVAFSCGNSLDPNTPEKFDVALGEPYDPGSRGVCTQNGSRVTCYLRENFDLTLDLTDANIPILGNTQTRGLTDAVKMTEYLSWFLNGTVQQSEQEPNPSVTRLVNYSGPLQKLLPFDLKNAVRSWLVEGPAGEKFVPPNSGGQYHNYIVGCQKSVDLLYLFENLKNFIKTSFSALIAAAVDFLYISPNPVDPLHFFAPPFAVDIYDLVTAHPEIGAQLSQIAGSIKNIRKDFSQIIPLLDQTQKLLESVGSTRLARNLRLVGEKNIDLFLNIMDLVNSLNLDVAVSCQQNDTVIRLKQFTPSHLPPDPTKYTSFSKYWDDYVWWRGYLNIPIVSSFVGPVDFFNQNVWAQLFQNIPFSSLEDTTGEVVISVSPEEHANMQDKDVVDAQDQPGATLKLIIKPKP